MKLTRVDSTKLKAAVEQSHAKFREGIEILRPYLVDLTDGEASSLPRPRVEFAKAALVLARAMGEFPDLAKATGFDGEAVREDVENATAFAPLQEEMERLARQIGQTRMVWMAEAFEPSMAVYALAKVRAKAEAKFKSLVDPLAQIFALPKRKDVKPEK
jgi:hypothetical protein